MFDSFKFESFSRSSLFKMGNKGKVDKEDKICEFKISISLGLKLLNFK